MIKGFINILAIAILGVVVIGGSVLGSWIARPHQDKTVGAFALVVPQGGTGDATLASGGVLVGNGTDHIIASSSPVLSSFAATSTTISSEVKGTLLVNNLTVTGSCTGCSAAAAVDLQDVYDNSAVDAQILTTAGKDIVFFLTNTDSNATVQILSGTNGEGQLQIGTANGSATTTTGIWAGYGGLGIGTTSPGGGLSVNATSTILSGPAYILDHLRTSFLIATSTQNNSFAGALDITEAATSTWTGGLSVGTGGLLSTTGITLSGGDLLLSSGKITVIGSATNTLPVLSVNTLNAALDSQLQGKLTITSSATSSNSGTFSNTNLLSSGSIFVSGAGTSTVVDNNALIKGNLTVGTGLTLLAGELDIPSLNVSGSGTTTFTGGISAAGLASSQGVVLSAGDLLLTTGRITLGGSATSTLPVLSVNTLNVALDSQLQGKLTVTSSATSTLPTLTVSRLNASLDAQFQGKIAITSTATSTFAGGININAGGVVIVAGGLDIQAGDLLSAGTLKVSSAATSTISGTLAINGTNGTSTVAGSWVVSKNLFTTNAVTQAACKSISFGSTVTIDWSQANCFAVAQATSDFIVDFVQIPPANFQNITLELSTQSSLFQPQFETASTSPIILWMNKKSTTTPAEIQEGITRCTFTATSSPNAIEGICASGGRAL